MTNITQRHHCRSEKCRSKLPEPVENEHHAFCTKACYDQFYRKRCLACEKPLRIARRSFCPKPAKCALRAHPPARHCLRQWWGSDPVESDLSLYDKDGLTLARLVLEGGRYCLR